jgi:hypothetical protein
MARLLDASDGYYARALADLRWAKEEEEEEDGDGADGNVPLLGAIDGVEELADDQPTVRVRSRDAFCAFVASPRFRRRYFERLAVVIRGGGGGGASDGDRGDRGDRVAPFAVPGGGPPTSVRELLAGTYTVSANVDRDRNRTTRGVLFVAGAFYRNNNTAVPDPRRVAGADIGAMLAAGHTAAFNKADRWLPGVHALARDISMRAAATREGNGFVFKEVNVYLAGIDDLTYDAGGNGSNRGGSDCGDGGRIVGAAGAGMAPHSDAECTLIAQLHGRKRWRVWLRGAARQNTESQNHTFLQRKRCVATAMAWMLIVAPWFRDRPCCPTRRPPHASWSARRRRRSSRTRPRSGRRMWTWCSRPATRCTCRAAPSTAPRRSGHRPPMPPPPLRLPIRPPIRSPPAIRRPGAAACT